MLIIIQYIPTSSSALDVDLVLLGPECDIFVHGVDFCSETETAKVVLFSWVVTSSKVVQIGDERINVSSEPLGDRVRNPGQNILSLLIFAGVQCAN
jgi:hypothetical protein